MSGSTSRRCICVPFIAFSFALALLCQAGLPLAAQPTAATESVSAASHSAPAAAAHSETHPETSQPGHESTAGHADHGEDEAHAPVVVPSLFWVLPFVTLLGCIAFLPLIPATEHWWHKNSSKLTVALVLALITLAHYSLRGFGIPHGHHVSEPGMATTLAILNHAVIADYIPFMVLLLSLFVISGGINVSGDVPAHPLTNTGILFLGGILASLIGTTGAAMLLIRPLLQFNRERHKVTHTVVFFIFVVCNIGGCLLPIGDPPLFLGYLRGVPFTWTLHLFKEWAFCLAVVLSIYYLWDSYAWKHERISDLLRDEKVRQPVKILGGWNGFLLVGVVFCVGLLVPGKEIPGLGWVVPTLPLITLREYVMLALAGVSLLFTTQEIRKNNDFSFFAINEVACLFIGIFICMQVPIEILNAKGAELGLSDPLHFFWATGALSSFLDNAPTYVVFFQTAGTLQSVEPALHGVQTATGSIPIDILAAISCGAVFMGAMTYIGNGPNFMVKSIAEQSGVKMPSFFGYMVYSIAILIPTFVGLTVLFFL